MTNVEADYLLEDVWKYKMSMDLMRNVVRGVWPVMLTPFDDRGAIDWGALDRLVDWYLSQEVAGLFACCQSSEIYDLSEREKNQLARRIIRRVNGRVPVVAGAMGQSDMNSREEACRTLWDEGAAAVILVFSEFGQAADPASRITRRLLEFANRVSDVALGLYECPKPYHRCMDAELLGELALSERFVWLKETSCDDEQLKSKIEACRDTPLSVYNAYTNSIHTAMTLGAVGYSGTAANFCPRVCAEICRSWAHPSDLTIACTELLLRANRQLFLFGYPANAKHYLQALGLPIEANCRVDHSPVPPQQQEIIDVYMQEFAGLERKLRSDSVPRLTIKKRYPTKIPLGLNKNATFKNSN